jgi:hypothetical protein
MTAGSWFSNPPDLEGIHSLKIPPHEDFHQNLWQAERVAILAIGESPMNPVANHGPLPKLALWSLLLNSVPQMFPPFGPFPSTPPFPRRPVWPLGLSRAFTKK